MFTLGLLLLLGVSNTLQQENGNSATGTQTEPDEAEINATLIRIQEYETALARVIENITVNIVAQNWNSTEYKICPAGSWMNSLNLTAQKDGDNVLEVYGDCVGVPFLGNDSVKPIYSNITNFTVPEDATTETINRHCESEVGSFAIGILANLKNRVKKEYSFHMVKDLKLICGGLPYNPEDEHTHSWHLLCENGTAICAVQTHLSKFTEEKLYTTGLTIGCCAVPQEFAFSASGLIYKDVLKGGAGNSTTSLCIGGDYMHEVKVETVHSTLHNKSIYKLDFQCGTPITKDNKYDLIDVYKIAMPNGTLQYAVNGSNNSYVRIATCSGTSLMTGIGHFLNDGIRLWNPICQPSPNFVLSDPKDMYTFVDDSFEQILCDQGYAMCGVQGAILEKDDTPPEAEHGINIKFVCCPIKLSLCDPKEIDEPLDTDHCNIFNSDTTCTIEYRVGTESSVKQTETDSTRQKFSTSIGVEAEAGTSKAKVAASATFTASHETTKTNSKFEANKDSSSRLVTASFPIKRGERLAAFQKVVSCGGTTLRSDLIVYIVIPSNLCIPVEELIEIPMDGNSTETTLNGLGLYWHQKPKQELHKYLTFETLKLGIPERFYNNVNFTPSAYSGYDWGSGKRKGEYVEQDEIWKEYNKDAQWPAQIKAPGFPNPKYYRVIGRCGQDWTVATNAIVAKPEDFENNSTDSELDKLTCQNFPISNSI